jgi:hypothetical protein
MVWCFHQKNVYSRCDFRTRSDFCSCFLPFKLQRVEAGYHKHMCLTNTSKSDEANTHCSMCVSELAGNFFSNLYGYHDPSGILPNTSSSRLHSSPILHSPIRHAHISASKAAFRFAPRICQSHYLYHTYQLIHLNNLLHYIPLCSIFYLFAISILCIFSHRILWSPAELGVRMTSSSAHLWIFLGHVSRSLKRLLLPNHHHPEFVVATPKLAVATPQARCRQKV